MPSRSLEHWLVMSFVRPAHPHLPGLGLPGLSSLAVYAARNGLLYSLNCQSSEARWPENEAGFRRAAESFTILNSGVATAGFPDRL